MSQPFNYRPWPLGAWEEWKYKFLCALVALPAAAYAGYRAAEYLIPPTRVATTAAKQVYWLKWSGVAVAGFLAAFLILNPLLRLLGRFYTRRAARGNLPRAYWRSVPEAPPDPQIVDLLAVCPADLVARCTSFHQLRLARTHPEVIDLGIPDTFWADNEPPAFVLSTWQRIAGVAERLPKPIDGDTGRLLRRAANYVPAAWLTSVATSADLAAQVARADSALRRRGIDPTTLTRPTDAPAAGDDLTIAADLLPDSFHRPPALTGPSPWPQAHLAWCWPRIKSAAMSLSPPLSADDGILLRRCAHLLPLRWLDRCRTRDDLRRHLETALRALNDLGVNPDQLPDSPQHQAHIDRVELLGHVYDTFAHDPALLHSALAQAKKLDPREALPLLRRNEPIPQLQQIGPTPN